MRSIAILLIFSATVCAAEPFEGDWAGGFGRDGGWTILLIHLNANGHEVLGTGDVFSGSVIGHPLDALTAEANHVRFEFNKDNLHLSFEGECKDNTISGQVHHDGQEFSFRLDRVIKADPSRFAGTYEQTPGHYIIVGPAGIKLEGIKPLYCLDTESGLPRVLFQIAETTFISSACFGVGPAEDVLDFATDDPHQRTLKWTPKHGDSFLAHAVTLPEEEISFKDGDVTLAGSLLLPSTPGPYPAVVFVHGSGPSSRNDYRLIASYFAANGVAALIFDKRGVGKSSGNWAASGFDELAGDALAAIETLKTRADIQPRNIGLCGMSQAGWIMPLAASRSPDVAFLISLSGPGVSPEEQGAYMVEHRVRSENFSDADVAEALALYRLDSQCARSGSGWEKFDATVAQARKKPWFHPDFIPQDPSTERQWQAICDYDPVPVLQKVRCPVLAVLGGMDPLVPAEKSASIWKNALAAAKNPAATIKVWPYANHGLADPKLGIQGPEFFTIQRDWLRQHLRQEP